MSAPRAFRLVERNLYAYRRNWPVFVSAFVEPLFFLLSIGVGVGELAGHISVAGRFVDYEQFVAPGLFAVAAMNGALFDSTFNFFIKYKYWHIYDGILATPVNAFEVATGEMLWSLLRGSVYSIAFLGMMVALGLVASWWALLAIPVAMLIGFAFASAGLAATTYMRSFIDFDYVNLVMIPLFLFSATFFPLSQYPDVLAFIVRCTPLYQGVVLCRSLVLGELHWTLCANAAYLAVMGAVGLRLAGRRIRQLLQP
ncbi:MAG: ABC transporter permease [Actinomycetota bacterium]